MEDKELIKELAKDMGTAFQLAGTTRFGEVAESLIRWHWVKLNKDSIAISKEEYEHLKAKSTRIPIDKDGNFIEYAVYDTDRVLSKPEYRDYIYEKGSKETAKRWYEWVIKMLSSLWKDKKITTYTHNVWVEVFNKLAKEYDVE